jgi:hypothetical protein
MGRLSSAVSGSSKGAHYGSSRTSKFRTRATERAHVQGAVWFQEIGSTCRRCRGRKGVPPASRCRPIPAASWPRVPGYRLSRGGLVIQVASRYTPRCYGSFSPGNGDASHHSTPNNDPQTRQHQPCRLPPGAIHHGQGQAHRRGVRYPVLRGRLDVRVRRGPDRPESSASFLAARSSSVSPA